MPLHHETEAREQGFVMVRSNPAAANSVVRQGPGVRTGACSCVDRRGAALAAARIIMGPLLGALRRLSQRRRRASLAPAQKRAALYSDSSTGEDDAVQRALAAVASSGSGEAGPDGGGPQQQPPGSRPAAGVPVSPDTFAQKRRGPRSDRLSELSPYESSAAGDSGIGAAIINHTAPNRSLSQQQPPTPTKPPAIKTGKSASAAW